MAPALQDAVSKALLTQLSGVDATCEFETLKLPAHQTAAAMVQIVKDGTIDLAASIGKSENNSIDVAASMRVANGRRIAAAFDSLAKARNELNEEAGLIIRPMPAREDADVFHFVSDATSKIPVAIATIHEDRITVTSPMARTSAARKPGRGETDGGWVVQLYLDRIIDLTMSLPNVQWPQGVKYRAGLRQSNEGLVRLTGTFYNAGIRLNLSLDNAILSISDTAYRQVQQARSVLWQS